MNKFNYKNLTPFKWFVLENFPFIEADFDALTEWQLFCKLGKEMNKIINSENTLGTQVENVTNAFIELQNAFIELQNYVNNYFDNLDVQEEINNKLNIMVEDGTFQNILKNFLNIQRVYHNITELKSDLTLVKGNICKTLNRDNFNDCGGGIYIIIDNLENNIIDNSTFIQLDNNLYAKLLIQGYVEPAQFAGVNDNIKLLNAYTFALNNEINIKISRIYNIDGTIDLNRNDKKWTRQQVYFIGNGGGFQKNNEGYMFTSSDTDTGDFNFSNIKFYSTKGVGTVIFNFNNIIRTKILNCEFKNVDTIAEANTRYFQSIILENNTINGGGGWKLTAKKYLDTVIMNNLIEDCEHFICNSENLNAIQNVSLQIMNNCIENLKGTTLKLGTSYNVNIENNYIELNNEYFDLATLNTFGHMALTIKNNHFNISTEQINNNIPAIKLSDTATTGKKDNGGCFSSGNTSNGILYELLFNSSSFITGIGDIGTINGTNYINLGKPNYDYSGALKSFAGIHSFTKSYFNIPITVGEEVTSQIELPFVFKSNYMIDVKSTNKYFQVVKVVTQPETNIVDVTVKNTASSGTSCTLNVNIMYVDFLD